MTLVKYIFVLSILFTWVGPSFAADATPIPSSESPQNKKSLDGITIEAVDIYANPRHHEFALGFGLLPLNAYCLGFSGNLSYTYFFNSTWAWEVLNGGYVFNVEKDLSSQLANNFGVNPQRIEKLQYLISTDAVYHYSYGKSVLFKKYIQYFRGAILGGVSHINTSVQSSIAVNLGTRVDGFINESFSWRLELRDSISFSGGSHYVALNIGTGIYF